MRVETLRPSLSQSLKGVGSKHGLTSCGFQSGLTSRHTCDSCLCPSNYSLSRAWSTQQRDKEKRGHLDTSLAGQRSDSYAEPHCGLWWKCKMSVIWVKVEDEELHPRSQSFCIHSSSIQLTAGIAASFCTPSSRVWISGGLMAISLNFQTDRD